MTNYNEPAGQSSTLAVDLGAERIECTLRAASDNVVTVVGDAHDGAASWSVDVLAQTAERTIALQLARLTSAPPSGPAVELAAARLLAAAQRLVLAGQERPGGSKVEADALDNLNATDLADRLLNDMVRLGFRADPNVGVVLYLCKLTALLHAPVYVYLVGPASSLKTTYADYVAALTPPEMVKHLTELTPRALYYGSGDLRHHVIALDELDLKGRTLALDHKVLRMLFSKSWCEIETTQGGRAQRGFNLAPRF